MQYQQGPGPEAADKSVLASDDTISPAKQQVLRDQVSKILGKTLGELDVENIKRAVVESVQSQEQNSILKKQVAQLLKEGKKYSICNTCQSLVVGIPFCMKCDKALEVLDIEFEYLNSIKRWTDSNKALHLYILRNERYLERINQLRDQLYNIQTILNSNVGNLDEEGYACIVSNCLTLIMEIRHQARIDAEDDDRDQEMLQVDIVKLHIDSEAISAQPKPN